KEKDIPYSTMIERLLEQLITKNDELFVDELYAPRISGMVESAVKKEVDRLAKMVYNNHVDTNAVLIGIPSLYKKIQKGMEESLVNYMNPQLLQDDISPLYAGFVYGEHGVQMINSLRNKSREDIQERKRNSRKGK
ncbi:hypothetical protein, partial [Cryptosporangium minutisporangium]